MIDLDDMLSSTARLHRVFGGSTRATQTIGEVLELLNRLTQAEKDARRYRWLRDTSSDSDFDIMTVIESSEWDETIDEAMK